MARKYTPARRDAVERYQSKTYKKIGIALRLDEDADIIASWTAAKDLGISSREWLRELFENQK